MELLGKKSDTLLTNNHKDVIDQVKGQVVNAEDRYLNLIERIKVCTIRLNCVGKGYYCCSTFYCDLFSDE